MTPRTSTRLASVATSATLLVAALVGATVTTGQASAAAAGASVTVPGSYTADGTCTTTALGASAKITSRSGKKLGSARMYAGSIGEDLGFCVRITVIRPLRKVTTQAYLPHKTYFPDGAPSSSGLVGGSGAWRQPFFVVGSDFGPGSSMRATARIKVPGGPSGKAKLVGVLS